MVRAWAVLAVGFLAASLPSVGAVHQGADDVNALDLNVVLHHPLPDEKGDPWGIPAANLNGTDVDWLAGYYGSYYFPTAVFDGLMVVESVPQEEGAGAYNETYEGYRRIMEVRRGVDPPLRIHLEVTGASTLEVAATFLPAASFAEQGLVPRFVLYEDDVSFNGGNGIFNHRFVVRAMTSLDALDFSGGEAIRATTTFLTDGLGDPARAGIVVYVQNTREDSAFFKFKEILQSATWRSGQTGPTHQASKAVLLEMYSATWCAACVYGDAAADNLANQFGVVSARIDAGAFAYLRPGPAWLMALGVVAAVAAGWAAGPRHPKRPSEGPT